MRRHLWVDLYQQTFGAVDLDGLLEPGLEQSAALEDELYSQLRQGLLERHRAALGREEQLPARDINEVLLALEARFHEQSFSIKGLADELGMSPSGLSHFFKRYTGENISDSLTRLRLDEAKRLLSATARPVSDIADQVGYASASSLITAFRRAEGVTPGVWRQRHASAAGAADAPP